MGFLLRGKIRRAAHAGSLVKMAPLMGGDDLKTRSDREAYPGDKRLPETNPIHIFCSGLDDEFLASPIT